MKDGYRNVHSNISEAQTYVVIKYTYLKVGAQRIAIVRCTDEEF
jgi:hypothetical protein